jgi:hypothetical protein
MEITIYRRHSADCKHKDDRYHPRCGCSLWFQFNGSGPNTTLDGNKLHRGQNKWSAETCIWSEAQTNRKRLDSELTALLEGKPVRQNVTVQAAPVAVSTAVRTLLSTPVIQTMPPLNTGLKEPGGMRIRSRALFVDGSTRTRFPCWSVTIQTLSSLAAIPPSAPAGAIGSVALIAFFVALIRTRAGLLPQIGTHRLSKPNARPEQASPGILTLARVLLVAGSIRTMSYGFVLATHTAFSVIRTQSAVPPILIVTDGRIDV